MPSTSKPSAYGYFRSTTCDDGCIVYEHPARPQHALFSRPDGSWDAVWMWGLSNEWSAHYATLDDAVKSRPGARTLP